PALKCSAARASHPCSRSSAHWLRRTGKSCGGGRTDDARPQLVRNSYLSLPGRECLVFAHLTLVTRAPTVAISAAPAPVNSAVKSTFAPTVVAVAIGFAHHR